MRVFDQAGNVLDWETLDLPTQKLMERVQARLDAMLKPAEIATIMSALKAANTPDALAVYAKLKAKLDCSDHPEHTWFSISWETFV